MYGGFTFGHVYGFNRPKKAKKVAKPPKDNWFERLSNDELKSLCRSAKLPVSGTKAELVARLLSNQSTARFGVESKAGTFLRMKCS